MNDLTDALSLRVSDRNEIRDLLARYCRAVDRLDEEEIRSVFHPDAVIDKGVGALSREPYIDDLLTRHAGVPAASHQVTNMLVDFIDTDTAFVETYGNAVEHRRADADADGSDAVFRVRYGDIVSRRDGVWRVERRRLVVDNVLRFPVEPDAAAVIQGRFFGERSANDPIAQFRADALTAAAHPFAAELPPTTQQLTPLEALTARSDCRDLIEDYTLAVNDGDIDAFVELFLSDAVWERPGTDPLHGQDQIRSFMQSRPMDRTLRHVTGGVRIRVLDAAHATARSQTLVFTGPGSSKLPVYGHGLVKMVEYADQLRRTESGWRFAERVTTTVFSERDTF